MARSPSTHSSGLPAANCVASGNASGSVHCAAAPPTSPNTAMNRPTAIAVISEWLCGGEKVRFFAPVNCMGTSTNTSDLSMCSRYGKCTGKYPSHPLIAWSLRVAACFRAFLRKFALFLDACLQTARAVKLHSSPPRRSGSPRNTEIAHEIASSFSNDAASRGDSRHNSALTRHNFYILIYSIRFSVDCNHCSEKRIRRVG
eukprot:COSAG02_NODE_193_length_29843_cov_30.519903_16_plen_201_part_00